MRLLIALAAIAVPLASTPAHTPSAEEARVRPLGGARSDCRRADLYPADSAIKGRFNRLGELPPGELVLTVYREVDGCPDPLIVRQGYGFGEPGGEPSSQTGRPKARRW